MEEAWRGMHSHGTAWRGHCTASKWNGDELNYGATDKKRCAVICIGRARLSKGIAVNGEAVEMHSADSAVELRNGIAGFSKEVERRSEEMCVEDKE